MIKSFTVVPLHWHYFMVINCTTHEMYHIEVLCNREEIEDTRKLLVAEVLAPGSDLVSIEETHAVEMKKYFGVEFINYTADLRDAERRIA